MNIMKTFLLGVAVELVFASFVCLASANLGPLGQGFYLPSSDILGDYEAGTTIFSTIKPSCVKDVERPVTRQDRTFFQSSESFYQYVSTQTDVSAKLIGSFTMGTTLKVVSKSVSSSSHESSGLTIDIFSIKNAKVVSSQCQNTLPLSKEFLEDFSKLPVTIENPNSRNDWLPYHSFLEKYGSHIVKEIQYGSRIQQWNFASSSKGYSEKDFNTRACLDLSSNTGSMKVATCTDYSKKQIKRAKKMTMSDLLVVKGGTPETRAKLRKERTAELIEKFMLEAQSSPGRILYKWTGIWNLLKQRFIGVGNDDQLSRALNMEIYYKAVLDFGCTFSSKSDLNLRWLERNTQSKLPDYSCMLAALGCRSGDDCHIGGWGSVCYCYGKTCVDTEKVNNQDSKIKENRFIKKNKKGSYKEGVNKSCYYHAGATCRCHKDWDEPKKVWQSNDELKSRELLFGVHFKVNDEINYHG
ncbi:DELTA-thalatoxin-Avl2a-like [Dendronephthya gigantea]|uniref:DELTA-thalatoxin-Avl2a-like n=1 Tax=Dendronephthya gigantea TaxID=151771 RepID=UPI00106CE1BA|nr:DELTA-thalatoxin-Avl2a-like [Dendronephthya gigantea]